MRLLPLVILLCACGAGSAPDKVSPSTTTEFSETTTTASTSLDADGDGALATVDCDDNDAHVFPGADERCDGLDTDCDATTDEAGLITLGTTNYDMVQHAIGASSPGDTIAICAGQLPAALTTLHDLTLWGPAGSEVTVLAGSGTAPVVMVESGELTLSGLTLSGGDGVYGGGVSAQNADLVFLNDVVVRDNTGAIGGGAAFGAGGATLDGVAFVDNTAAGSGGGFIAIDGGQITATQLTVSGGTADSGGGVYLSAGTSLTGDFTVQDNVANWGGGVGMIDAELTGGAIHNNLGNSAGGGVRIDGDGVLADLEMTGNDSVFGGGFCGENGTVSATNLTVTGNHATDNGAAVYLLDVVFTGVALHLENNDADVRGGGMYAGMASTVDLSNTAILGNTAGSYGGAVYLNEDVIGAFADVDMDGNYAERGAGMYINGGATGTFTDCNLTSNGTVDTVSGGAFRVNLGTVQLNNVDLGEDTTDNAPHDIYTSGDNGVYDGYGAGTTLACTELGCL